MSIRLVYQISHANGASFFFIVVYAHLLRGLFYGSYFYPKTPLVFRRYYPFTNDLTSFLGYVLPWGQMSYWAATVITNLASTVPLFGQSIVTWLWSGFSVDSRPFPNFLLCIFVSLSYLGLVLYT
jgi:quinol-cytochrome oxidoreductase complex cytochrome b subunit